MESAPALNVLHLAKRYTHGRKAETVFEGLSFDVRPGDVIGVVGLNGSGKTTLLKMLSGIVRPSGGSIEVSGTLAAVVDIESNLVPELNLIENIRIFHRLYDGSRGGTSSMDVKRVIEFSGLSDAALKPVSTYSSGMRIRASFAMALNSDADIFVIDEVLAVGDQGFQTICIEALHRLIDRGKMMILASHDVGLLRSLCNKALLMTKGAQPVFDSATMVFDLYESRLRGEDELRIGLQGPIGAKRVSILHARVIPGSVVSLGDDVEVELVIDVRDETGFGMTMNVTANGTRPFFTNGRVYVDGRAARSPLPIGHYTASFKFPRDVLAPNIYSVGVDIHDGKGTIYETFPRIVSFEVRGGGNEELYSGHRSYLVAPMIDWSYRPLRFNDMAIVREADVVSNLQTKGHSQLPLLEEAKCEQLRALYLRYKPHIDAENGNYISINTRNIEVRRACSDAIESVLSDYLDKSFRDYEVAMCSFMAKEKEALGGIGFHQEPTLIDPRVNQDFTVWLPLENLREDGDGMLYMVSGSHLWADRISYYDPDFVPPLEKCQRKEVPIRCSIGQGLLFFNHVYHRSAANTNLGERLAVSIKLVRADAGIFSYFRDHRKGLVRRYRQSLGYHLSAQWDQSAEPSLPFDLVSRY
jgi:ABC-type polysaccharide/polyol phosphate transport system ATPase subunit